MNIRIAVLLVFTLIPSFVFGQIATPSLIESISDDSATGSAWRTQSQAATGVTSLNAKNVDPTFGEYSSNASGIDALAAFIGQEYKSTFIFNSYDLKTDEENQHVSMKNDMALIFISYQLEKNKHIALELIQMNESAEIEQRYLETSVSGNVLVLLDSSRNHQGMGLGYSWHNENMLYAAGGLRFFRTSGNLDQYLQILDGPLIGTVSATKYKYNELIWQQYYGGIGIISPERKRKQVKIEANLIFTPEATTSPEAGTSDNNSSNAQAETTEINIAIQGRYRSYTLGYGAGIKQSEPVNGTGTPQSETEEKSMLGFGWQGDTFNLTGIFLIQESTKTNDTTGALSTSYSSGLSLKLGFLF